MPGRVCARPPVAPLPKPVSAHGAQLGHRSSGNPLRIPHQRGHKSSGACRPHCGPTRRQADRTVGRRRRRVQHLREPSVRRRGGGARLPRRHADDPRHHRQRAGHHAATPNQTDNSRRVLNWLVEYALKDRQPRHHCRGCLSFLLINTTSISL